MRGTKVSQRMAAERRRWVFCRPEVHRLEDRLPPGRILAFSQPEPDPAGFHPAWRSAGVNEFTLARLVQPERE
jgi:hypothetical protein